jgi:photosystem II stability/assembly factor-like uncharacterized protein
VGLAAQGAISATEVGTAGGVRTTTDNGATWTARTSGVTADLHASDAAPGGTMVWAVGDAGTIIASTDGGVTWTQQGAGVTNQQLYAVDAIDSANVWAVGAGGTILHTKSGGATWTAETSGVVRDLYSISVVSPTVAWAAGDDGDVLVTTDAGTTWTVKKSGQGQTAHVAALSATTAMYSLRASLAGKKTTDGGTTWTAPFDNSGLGRGWDLRSQGSTFWAASYSPYGANVQRSDDGGLTWTLQTGSAWLVHSMSILDANTAFFGGSNNTNNGATYFYHPTGGGPTISDYGGAPNNWATGGANSLFGACVQAVSLSATVQAPWTVDGNGNCTASDTDPWRAIPTAPSKVAQTSSAGQSGRVDVVWGVQIATNQAPGTYRASVLVEALAPAV